MRKSFYILIFVLLSGVNSGCITKQDLYGNWYSPQAYGDSRKTITEKYAVTFVKYDAKNRIVKAHYDVKNHGLFLRVKNTSGLVDNVYNIFGFLLIDRTRYWLGFIPISGFQYSYKISDEEMLDFLKKYNFTKEQVIDKPILFKNGKEIPDHSVPPLLDKLNR